MDTVNVVELRGLRGLRERFRAFFSFIIFKDVELIASSIAYNAMLGFFPGLLLLKYIQNMLGVRVVQFTYVQELSSIAPQPMIEIANSFLNHIADTDGVALSLSAALFVLLIIKSVAGTFSGFLSLFESLTGCEASILRKKALSTAAALCVLVVSALIFVCANLEALSNPAWLVEQELGQTLHIRLFVSAGLVVVGMAALFRILAGNVYSKFAVWVGAALTSALWLGVCFLFFSYKFDFADEQRLYGAVTATIAMLIWFYLTALSIIIGMVFSYFVIDGKKLQ